MKIVPYGAVADPADESQAYHSRPGLVRLDGPAMGNGLVEVFPSSTSYHHHTKPEAVPAAPKRPRDAKGRLLPKPKD